jgi:hypothetical protein
MNHGYRLKQTQIVQRKLDEGGFGIWIPFIFHNHPSSLLKAHTSTVIFWV